MSPADDEKFAARLAVEALKKARKPFAFDYNLSVILGGPQTPRQEHAARSYLDLTRAIEVIKRWGGLVVLAGSLLACTLTGGVGGAPKARQPLVLSILPTDQPLPESESVGQAQEGDLYYVCTEALNIREAPGHLRLIVGWLERGDVVRVYEQVDGWGRLSNGWVKMDFLCWGSGG